MKIFGKRLWGKSGNGHPVTFVNMWRIPSRNDPRCFNYIFSVVFGVCLFMTFVCSIIYWAVKNNHSMSRIHMNILIGFMVGFVTVGFLMVFGKAVHEACVRKKLNRVPPIGSRPILSFDSESGNLTLNDGLSWSE